MGVIDTLVTDRTQADVDRVKALAAKWVESEWTGTTAELEEWLSGTMKGAYNASDLNRVTAAMEYVLGRLNEYGYMVPYTKISIPHADASTSYTWLVSDIPTPGQMAQYLENLSNLRAAISVKTTTPDVPDTMEHLGVEEANDIEKILADLDELLTNMAAAWYYSGDLYSCEV